MNFKHRYPTLANFIKFVDVTTISQPRNVLTPNHCGVIEPTLEELKASATKKLSPQEREVLGLK